MTTSLGASTPPARLSANGASVSSNNAWPDWRNKPDAADRWAFPPDVVIEIKSMACELPHRLGLPLSRFSLSELKREAIGRGIVASIGETTIWRWLSEDAIRPWRHRSWIFPQDPNFRRKAGRILDLYAGRWHGRALYEDDYVISADEKTSIQARRRIHETLAPDPGDPMRVEHHYERKGAWAYLAAWDVHEAKIFGRCEAKTGIAPFGRLVHQVMRQEPYRSAHRVFWIVDNGSSHRGERSIARLEERWPNLRLVHTPNHASWLNQIEIYFSIVQRKLLMPNDFNSRTELKRRMAQFEAHYQDVARPFEWKFTRWDLNKLLKHLESREHHPLAKAA
jgi:transposase